MDIAVETVLADFEKREVAESRLIAEMSLPEYMHRRDEFLIPIGCDTGILLNTLVKAADARRILELGTCYGYSTIWLAEAARETGGKVITTEIAPGKVKQARDAIVKAGLQDYVDFRVGDARTTLAVLDGGFDFVLLDLWKELYITCFDLLYPKLSSGAFVAADNMIQPERYRTEALLYRAHVRSQPRMTSVLLPIGNGVELSRYDDI
jgi:predicted O-methyltransferase YrrM